MPFEMVILPVKEFAALKDSDAADAGSAVIGQRACAGNDPGQGLRVGAVVSERA